MKSIIKFYVIGASENICKWIIMIFFFSKNYVLKNGKISMFFGKEIKRKVAIRIYCSPPKNTLQPEFFFWSPFGCE